MSEIPIDDGGDKPLGYVTPDGHLEVRESVDREGKPFRGYHETELGQHDRWLRQAPELFEKYTDLTARLTLLQEENTRLTELAYMPSVRPGQPHSGRTWHEVFLVERHDREALEASLSALQTQIARLREYVQHKPECRSRQRMWIQYEGFRACNHCGRTEGEHHGPEAYCTPCTCGLALLTGEADKLAHAEPLRCEVTGNPCGTDTLPKGVVCYCAPCRQSRLETGEAVSQEPEP